MRRVLVLVGVVFFAAVAAVSAQARRPAPWADLTKMTDFSVVPAKGGYVGVAWVSSSRRGVGLVLLYPGRYLPAAQKTPTQRLAVGGGVTIIASPRRLAKAARPVAAYLFREQARHPKWPWSLLAQTLLRGQSVNRAELASFCAVGRHTARDLTQSVCR